MGYFIFGVVGAMWHESRMLNLALKKVWKGMDGQAVRPEVPIKEHRT